MKIAEGLSHRADAQRRVEQLRTRIAASARYQEGEEPAENAPDLVAEAERVLADLQSWISRINRTNAAVDLGEDGTLTDALARRDVLRLHHGLLTGAANAAADDNGYRQLRSELRQVSALPVRELRTRADDVARQLRELDIRIQQAGWSHDLLD